MPTSKRILIACIVAFLPGLLSAQEERAAIVGSLDDGSSVPAIPAAPPLPQFQVLETSEKQLPDRKLILHRVANSGLLPSMSPAAANPAQISDTGEPKQFIIVTATVVDRKASLLKWWHGGTEYQAWSSVDFNYLTVINGVRKGGKDYKTVLMVGNSSVSPGQGQVRYEIPAGLPSDVPSLLLIKGNPAD